MAQTLRRLIGLATLAAGLISAQYLPPSGGNAPGTFTPNLNLTGTNSGGQIVVSPYVSGNNIVIPGGFQSGSGGSASGFLQLGQGTTATAGTTNITIQAPTSVTSYVLTLPGAAASGIPLWTNAAGVVTETLRTFTSGTGIIGGGNAGVRGDNFLSVSGIGTTTEAWTFYNSVASGATNIAIKQNSSQGSTSLLTFLSSSGGIVAGATAGGEIYDLDVPGNFLVQFSKSGNLAGLAMNKNGCASWTSTSNSYNTGSQDTGLCRTSAGVVEVETTATGGAGTLKANSINVTGSSFSFNGKTCTIVAGAIACS